MRERSDTGQTARKGAAKKLKSAPPPIKPVKQTLTKSALINLLAEENEIPRKTAAGSTQRWKTCSSVRAIRAASASSCCPAFSRSACARFRPEGRHARPQSFDGRASSRYWAGRNPSIERADDDKIRSPLSPPSLSTGGDQHGGLAVFSPRKRMVEEMLAARGIDVSHETVRRWAEKFGRDYANRLRRRAIRPGDTSHLDEVVITIAGEKHWLCAPSTVMGPCLTFLFRSGATPKPQSA